MLVPYGVKPPATNQSHNGLRGNLLQRLDDQIGVSMENLARRRPGQCDGDHPGAPRGFEPGRRVFDHDTSRRIKLQLLRGQQKNIRIGFPMLDLCSVHRRGEEIRMTQPARDDRDILRRSG